MSEAAGRPFLQPVDDSTRAQARQLIRSARYAALAVCEPGTGHPLASRVALSTDVDGTPLILISGLSAHTGALQADGRCSLLVGEPGRGDPLAHPRLTFTGQARRIERDDAHHDRIRRRYLARQPKAALYADFGDFAFWRIEALRASLNGGFGRAHELDAADVLSPIDDLTAFGELDADACEHMNTDHPHTVQLLAGPATQTLSEPWRMATIDPHGVDLAIADQLRRIEFPQAVTGPQELHQALRQLAQVARSAADS